uniref:Bug family tripartite tricarboxylate transporter substrate binding protein n=1 Tax=Marinobacterium profundum TaxID=1714300 RepID=UPI00082EF067|nr:tripartite tricarboxylate transporter substrate binding protein [Marinobacterium profundum]
MQLTSFFKSAATLITATCLSLSAATAAQADTFPSRPINLVVPFNAGGGVDAYARALAAGARDLIDVPVVVVNKPGAGGLTGAQSVATARPDGYTLLLTSGGSFLLNTMLNASPVDMFENFQFVSQIGQLSTALMVPANSPYKSANELIAALQENPGKLRWAHSGRGGFHYIAGRAFLESNNLTAQDVPFKGGSPARAALAGAQTDFGFMGIQQARGFGELIHPLALVADERDGIMQDIPTFKELNIPFVNIGSPVVVMAPTKTAADVVAQLNQYLEQITATTTFAELIEKQGTAALYAQPAVIEQKMLDMRTASTPVITQLTGQVQ